jgi:hypothetical protein
LKKAHVEMEGKDDLKVIVNGDVTLKRGPCEEGRLGKEVPHRIV